MINQELCSDETDTNTQQEFERIYEQLTEDIENFYANPDALVYEAEVMDEKYFQSSISDSGKAFIKTLKNKLRLEDLWTSKRESKARRSEAKHLTDGQANSLIIESTSCQDENQIESKLESDKNTIINKALQEVHKLSQRSNIQDSTLPLFHQLFMM